eukprot:1158066-Pelagomonas_calceolata.AAC.10
MHAHPSAPTPLFHAPSCTSGAPRARQYLLVKSSAHLHIFLRACALCMSGAPEAHQCLLIYIDSSAHQLIYIRACVLCMSGVPRANSISTSTHLHQSMCPFCTSGAPTAHQHLLINASTSMHLLINASTSAHLLINSSTPEHVSFLYVLSALQEHPELINIYSDGTTMFVRALLHMGRCCSRARDHRGAAKHFAHAFSLLRVHTRALPSQHAAAALALGRALKHVVLLEPLSPGLVCKQGGRVRCAAGSVVSRVRVCTDDTTRGWCTGCKGQRCKAAKLQILRVRIQNYLGMHSPKPPPKPPAKQEGGPSAYKGGPWWACHKMGRTEHGRTLKKRDIAACFPHASIGCKPAVLGASKRLPLHDGYYPRWACRRSIVIYGHMCFAHGATAQLAAKGLEPSAPWPR